MKKSVLMLVSVALGASVFATVLKNGDSVAFLGDSITQQGWGSCGYVRMCEAAFKANGLDVKIFPAGISGHKSNNMLERLQRDVLSKKPAYMTLSCGVNDVWHGKNGVPLPQYKENITAIVERTLAAGVKPIVLTATMIYEDAEGAFNKQLVPYNEFLRTLAKEKGLVLVDLDAEMRKLVAEFRAKTGCKYNLLTVDGVHMNFLGNRMMAQMILRDGFDFTAEEMKKSEESFMTLSMYIKMPNACLSGESYMKLAEKALKAKCSTDKYLQKKISPVIDKAVKDLLDAEVK